MATVTNVEPKIQQGLVLTCHTCGAKNYLDPYPFWNFAGNTKCAGCDQVYAIAFKNGQVVKEAAATSGKADLLPGYAENESGAEIGGSGKIRPAPQARPDPFSGKQKQIVQSIRGKVVSGRPLKKEELVGSRAKFIADLHKA
jgi:hypothetical protein